MDGLTVAEAGSRLSRMIAGETPYFKRVIWVLVFVWAFFGGVALAEEMNLLVETNIQDEEVLSELGSNPKPEASTVEGRLMVRFVITAVTAPVSSVRIVYGSQSPWVSVHDLSALRPHQRMSVYRI